MYIICAHIISAACGVVRYAHLKNALTHPAWMGGKRSEFGVCHVEYVLANVQKCFRQRSDSETPCVANATHRLFVFVCAAARYSEKYTRLRHISSIDPVLHIHRFTCDTNIQCPRAARLSTHPKNILLWMNRSIVHTKRSASADCGTRSIECHLII